MSQRSSDDLDAEFRNGDQMRVIERDGHAILAIATELAKAEIALQGAQVLSWRPAGHDDVLWGGPLPAAGSGKAIRGGIPICWPWFGPHPTDPQLPQHGLARTATWTLKRTALTPQTAHADLSLQLAGIELNLSVGVGERLTVYLQTRNNQATPLTITEALHSYFRVGDTGAIEIAGLDGARYRDNTAGGREAVQRGGLRIPAETNAHFDVAAATCLLQDQRLGRDISIARRGGQSTIVWNPGAAASQIADLAGGEERRFVCIESGNIGASAVTIAPGETHTLSIDIEVARNAAGT